MPSDTDNEVEFSKKLLNYNISIQEYCDSLNKDDIATVRYSYVHSVATYVHAFLDA